MSYEESKKRRAGNFKTGDIFSEDNRPATAAERRASNFKTGSDISMGLFYAFIGGLIVYGRAMQTIRMPDAIMEIPAFIVYILGTMLVIGGAFRFYRGIKAALPKKQNNDSPPDE